MIFYYSVRQKLNEIVILFFNKLLKKTLSIVCYFIYHFPWFYINFDNI